MKIIPQNFEFFGEGWAFGKNNKPDLSKFKFNEGYSISVIHFGISDPLIGRLDGPFWYDSIDNVIDLLISLKLENDFIEYLKERVDDGDSLNNLEECLNFVYNIVDDAQYYIGEYFNRKVLNLGSSECLFGVTDLKYLIELFISTNRIGRENAINTLKSGFAIIYKNGKEVSIDLDKYISI